MAVEVIQPEQVRIFAQKLEAFGSTLTIEERALLLDILYRAAGEETDVEGHLAIGSSLAAALLAAAASMGVTAAGATGHLPLSLQNQSSSHSEGQPTESEGPWETDDKGGSTRLP